MKKAVSILLLTYYLFSVIGVSITEHYCCGKITSVDVVSALSESSQTPYDMGGNCCKDVTQTLKMDAPQQTVSSAFAVHLPVLQVALSFLSFMQINSAGNSFYYKNIHTQPPPGYPTVSLFVRNESFLI